MPKELEVQQNSACNFTGIGLSPSYSCQADPLLNMITIKDFLLSPSLKGDQLVFELNSIRNPVDYITPGPVELFFETPSGDRIAYGNWSDWTTEYANSQIDQY